MFTIQPNLQTLPLDELRPTQLTVGLRAVEDKRRKLAALPPDDRERRMRLGLYPAVRGPTGQHFIIDRHHEALAALREGASQVVVGMVMDLSHLSMDGFWVYLDHRNWVHCYDAEGRRRGFDAVPKHFDEMADDPYRSLAASVEDEGGFSKPDEPFYEFLWANHFRALIKASRLQDDYDKAVRKACEIAHSTESRHLPGWAGVRD